MTTEIEKCRESPSNDPMPVRLRRDKRVYFIVSSVFPLAVS